MRRNKRPPTATEKRIVDMIELLILHGYSLNRACGTKMIAPATYYRLGGRTRDELMQMSEAKTGHAVASK